MQIVFIAHMQLLHFYSYVSCSHWSTDSVRVSLSMWFRCLLIYPDGIYFTLGFSGCAYREEPRSWCPSKSRKCGTGVWWLCSKIGRTIYILGWMQIIRITKYCFLLVIIATMLLFHSNLDQFYKADRGAHNYYLEKRIVDSRPDHVLNLIHYEVRMPFHL